MLRYGLLRKSGVNTSVSCFYIYLTNPVANMDVLLNCSFVTMLGSLLRDCALTLMSVNRLGPEFLGEFLSILLEFSFNLLFVVATVDLQSLSMIDVCP